MTPMKTSETIDAPIIAPVQRKPRRGVGAIDVIVVAAMAAVAIAFSYALRIQAGFSAVPAASLSSGLFFLLALVHVLKRRIDGLQVALPNEATIILPAAELTTAGLDERSLDQAAASLAATAQTLRDGSPTARPERSARSRSRIEPRLQPPQVGDESVGTQSPDADNVGDDHGWGEPGAVDDLVRQLAAELDREGTSAEAPADVSVASKPTPPRGQTAGARQAPKAAPPVPTLPAAPPAATAKPAIAPRASAGKDPRIAEAVERAATGDIEIHLQPIQALGDRKPRMYEVFPRLKDTHGTLLSQSAYASTAEVMGLSLAIERAAIVRCAAIMRALAQKGRARSLIVRLSHAGIHDRAYIEGLIAELRPDPVLADLLIFEVDQIELEQGAGDERENLELLGRSGFRFSLGRAETLALEVAELQSRRIAFVRISASTFATEQDATSVAELRSGGIETIITDIKDEASAVIATREGIVLGQGPLLSDPKPLKSDISRPTSKVRAA
jgi:cyclic-di-GMP phosphodiesterase, flagellum assembly factor TipF